MHNMGKIVNELHAMLKLHEQTLPKSNAPALHAIRAGKVQKGNKYKKSQSQMAAKGQIHGNGKNKQVYAPKPKIPPPPKRENPAKVSICHECGEIGHWKRICPRYLAELMKKKKNAASGAGGSDKGKGILVEEPKPLKKQAQIEQDEAYARELEAELKKNIDWDEVIEQFQRKEKEDNVMMRYQALKRKPQTKDEARKNMMIYLRIMVGFKMGCFKGMSYDDIRPIFEKKFNSNVAFLEKTREQMEEEDNEALKRASESQAEKAAKKQKLDEELEDLKKHLQIVPNNDDDVYIEATPLASRLEGDMELVKEIFASSKPKNFLDDFLLTTLTYMFEKPDVQAQIWKNQRSFHGLAKVKSQRLLKSCGVHIITFTTTQMILMVERRYPLTRFTLDQMFNNVRLEVEEESEVSLELLRFVRQQHQEGFRP
nr:zinc finger, CCHC-type [Tanacetum cinerariifolium]